MIRCEKWALKLTGSSESDSIHSEIIDGIKLANEHVTQDPQRAGRRRDVQSKESRNASAGVGSGIVNLYYPPPPTNSTW
jgi:hypothetical protein